MLKKAPVFCLWVGKMIYVNGKEEKYEKQSLESFLKQKGFKLEKTVVELNEKVVKKADYGQVILKEGDRLEVLSLVGGG